MHDEYGRQGSSAVDGVNFGFRSTSPSRAARRRHGAGRQNPSINAGAERQTCCGRHSEFLVRRHRHVPDEIGREIRTIVPVALGIALTETDEQRPGDGRHQQQRPPGPRVAGVRPARQRRSALRSAASGRGRAASRRGQCAWTCRAITVQRDRVRKCRSANDPPAAWRRPKAQIPGAGPARRASPQIARDLSAIMIHVAISRSPSPNA